jgi:predicted DNA-binding protein
MAEQEQRRRTTSITIDNRVLEELKRLAKNKGISVSRYIEEYFFDEFKRIGIFSLDEEPFKETRGGDRTKPNQ